MAAQVPPGYPLPRVTIQFCTQCKWMLRAAYTGPLTHRENLPRPQYAQELLSTFSTALGEVALQPSTGGTFAVSITHPSRDDAAPTTTTVLWDRRTDGGFPETKELKRRVRDVVEPGRDLGHVDRHHGVPAKVVGDGGSGKTGESGAKNADTAAVVVADEGKNEECKDCN
ncbi:hypothetical protein AK830_g9263 [Neonectria ditissima]|uniref:Selenoprotein W-like protein n=1 Tax=Neonectria ditissima TaxID=78410 RepID=A0A0P7B9T8_9HYPO|nr:hypothetical protein AK830_g9263 [Neonectria ditissima]